MSLSYRTPLAELCGHKLIECEKKLRFKRHPGFIQCIWIRQVADANNTAARFASAFEGVPAWKFKVFQDPSELMTLDPANGVCN